jgi:hypothetical protein
MQPLKTWRFLKKLKTELPYDPVIPLLGIYSEERKTGHNRDTWTPTVITALFTIAKFWKQPRCWIKKMDDWIKKMWYIYKISITQL